MRWHFAAQSTRTCVCESMQRARMSLRKHALGNKHHACCAARALFLHANRRADALAKACTWKHASCMLSCALPAAVCMHSAERADALACMQRADAVARMHAARSARRCVGFPLWGTVLMYCPLSSLSCAIHPVPTVSRPPSSPGALTCSPCAAGGDVCVRRLKSQRPVLRLRGAATD